MAATACLLVVRANRWTVYKPKPDWRGAAAWLAVEGAKAGKLAVVTTAPSLEAEFYLATDPGRRLEVVLTDGCKNRLPWHSLARQGGGSLWFADNESWTGCWLRVWGQATTASGLARGRERHFSNLILHELVAP